MGAPRVVDMTGPFWDPCRNKHVHTSIPFPQVDPNSQTLEIPDRAAETPKVKTLPKDFGLSKFDCNIRVAWWELRVQGLGLWKEVSYSELYESSGPYITDLSGR